MNVDFGPLLARIDKHLAGWKMGVPSFAGRLTLAKFVLIALWNHIIPPLDANGSSKLADGNVERYKSRLVVKGYTPTEGNLSEEVYMVLPTGFTSPKPNQAIVILNKWFSKLSTALQSLGYRHPQYDYSLFTKSSSSSSTGLLGYVDDIILAGTDIHEIEQAKHYLNTTFKIKDLGELNFFLSLEVARSSIGIALNQRKYCLDVLQDIGLLHSKLTATPMDSKIKLSSSNGSPLPNISLYHRLIGRLLYSKSTRPDITFFVQQLSQFLKCPTIVHLQVAHHILRYLKNSPSAGLFFPSSSSLQLKAFSDSVWAGCRNTLKSIVGYLIYLGSSLIS
ncbi:uncharacterized mitochondrial protein AtMg00810-like [Jatropha curcas]|uniref:uncharacterized mitochondrial protein AtMg00810-like n=1 Tax=Jatropha curcas TaxID=180498 RepID=UPI0018959FC9|nr:uncharacterized mitochondrial protein AtMg00810-like [Jatropha curcas]